MCVCDCVVSVCRYPTDKLFTGQVGYVITGNKDLKAARVGDTWTLHGTSHQAEPLPGFRPARSMVYAGLYPMNAADFDELAVVRVHTHTHTNTQSIAPCLSYA